MAIYPRGGKWWCRFKHRGQPRRHPTGISIADPGSAQKAREVEEVIKARAVLEDGPGGREATSQVTLGVLEELHVEKLENKGYGPKRLEGIRNLHRHLQEHLGGEHRDCMTLTTTDLDDYEGARRKEMTRGELTRGQTIKRERQALRRSMRFAKKDGLIPRMPFDWDDLDTIASDNPRKSQMGKLRPIAQINTVLGKLSAKAKTAGHEHLCRFVLMTGLRSEELARAADFPLTMLPKPRKKTRRARAVALLNVPDDGSKTSDPRTLPLIQEALGVFLAWRHRFATADVAHALIRASKLAGVQPGVTLRDLRKFYLSHAARHDLPAAQKLGGHKKVSTTALYVDAALERAVATGVRVARLGRGHSKGAQPMRRKKKTNIIKGARSSGG